MKLEQVKHKIDKYFDNISPEDLYNELKELKDEQVVSQNVFHKRNLY